MENRLTATESGGRKPSKVSSKVSNSLQTQGPLPSRNDTEQISLCTPSAVARQLTSAKRSTILAFVFLRLPNLEIPPLFSIRSVIRRLSTRDGVRNLRRNDTGVFIDLIVEVERIERRECARR